MAAGWLAQGLCSGIAPSHYASPPWLILPVPLCQQVRGGCHGESWFTLKSESACSKGGARQPAVPGLSPCGAHPLTPTLGVLLLVAFPSLLALLFLPDSGIGEHQKGHRRACPVSLGRLGPPGCC